MKMNSGDGHKVINNSSCTTRRPHTTRLQALLLSIWNKKLFQKTLFLQKNQKSRNVVQKMRFFSENLNFLPLKLG